MVLLDHMTHFHVKQSNFENTKWFLSYKQKCIQNLHKKSIFTRNAINSKPNDLFSSKLDTTVFPPKSVMDRPGFFTT